MWFGAIPSMILYTEFNMIPPICRNLIKLFHTKIHPWWHFLNYFYWGNWFVTLYISCAHCISTSVHIPTCSPPKIEFPPITIELIPFTHVTLPILKVKAWSFGLCGAAFDRTTARSPWMFTSCLQRAEEQWQFILEGSIMPPSATFSSLLWAITETLLCLGPWLVCSHPIHCYDGKCLTIGFPKKISHDL